MKTRKLIAAALFTALCCVATVIIQIPSPTGGYVNAGDAVVLLCAFLLGPAWGAVAAGLGCALADILSGYVIYAPVSFVIKAVMALVSGAALTKFGKKRPLLAAVAAGAIAEVIMIVGYFLFSAVFLKFGWGAVAGIPADAVQGIFGMAAGATLYAALSKLPSVEKITRE